VESGSLAHFALTALAYMSISPVHRTTHFDEGSFMHWEFVNAFWTNTLFLLQPQICIWIKLFNLGYLYATTSLLKFIYVSFILISVPVWSFCFGWLYVKFTNWLNHFPVLGKKVF
jgi:hypothetical protein